jgi:hypothetical protein
MTAAEIATIAAVLRSLEPDRGNRYAPPSVQTKGHAAHRQWRATCNTLATAILVDGRKGSAERDTFLTACGCPQWQGGPDSEGL